MMIVKRGVNLLVRDVEVISEAGTWVVLCAYPIPRQTTSPALPLFLKLKPDYKVAVGDKISDRDDDIVIGGSMYTTFNFWEVAKIIDDKPTIQLLDTIWEISLTVNTGDDSLWKKFQELIWDAPGFAIANLI
ncbi:hypothetical protein IPM19_00320 [bacterium]|nr:MAG: hypothetical protein IPM19_00320 [bacterium]